MFKILNGTKHFWQWDVDQRLVCDLPLGSQVHFYNGEQEQALVVETYESGGKILANVPNILMTKSHKLDVYAYIIDESEKYTKVIEVFEVKERVKPEDYVYTETEVLSYADLDARLKRIEDGGAGTGDMTKALYDTNYNGIVDNAEKVNNHTVEHDVPSDAVFTDTVYDDSEIKGHIDDMDSVIESMNDDMDLIAKSIPTKTSQLLNDSDFFITVKNGDGTWYLSNDGTYKPITGGTSYDDTEIRGLIADNTTAIATKADTTSVPPLIESYVESHKDELKGDTGATGATGGDGFSPTVTTSKSEKTTTITIVDALGAHTATVLDGNDGVNGSDGADGKTPVRGTDYWTTDDVDSMKAYIDDAILGGKW